MLFLVFYILSSVSVVEQVVFMINKFTNFAAPKDTYVNKQISYKNE